MPTEIKNELDRIEGAVGDIKTAITNRGVTVPTTAKINDLAPLVSSIPSGTNISGADAIPSQVVAGAKFVGANGVVEEGTLITADTVTMVGTKSFQNDGYYGFAGEINAPTVIQKGATVNVKRADFGAANPSSVVEEETFTSADGFCITGTLKKYAGSYVNADLENEIDNCLVIKADIEEPIYVKDEFYSKVPLETFGNASVGCVAEGYTFTSKDGSMLNGTLPYYDGTEMFASVYDQGDEFVHVESYVTKQSIMEDMVYSKIALANFGNATASDVRAGAIFTSAAGLEETGTMPDASFTVSGNTVKTTSTGAGYVAANTTVGTVSAGSATTPDTTITATNTITIDANGLITATASGSKSITPTVSAGYVSSGTAGTVSVSGTGTKQLTKRTSSSLTASGLTVTAPAGYYHSKATKTLTDSNLVASNIKKGVTIFGVTGTHEGGASIATCNVTIDISVSGGYFGVTATTFDGSAISTFAQNKSSGTFSIENVVCGSIITIICNGYFSISSSMSNNVVGASSFYLTAPSTTGDYTAEIIAYDD